MGQVQSKRKIVFISDHPLSTSGVGTQSRYLIHGLVATGKYTFKCLGAALKHDVYDTIKVNDDFIIKPIDGFGNRNLIRQILVAERPDALFLFTDPRFFYHVFEMHDEIHQQCPIVYNHLWDNTPRPEFNRVLYESTDLINCINWPTYEFCHDWFPDRTNYVPHAVPPDMFTPMSRHDIALARERMIGKERVDHFIPLFVSRNARRKAPSDVLFAFKLFLDRMEKEHGHKKSTMLMHCDPLDPEGPNLFSVVDVLELRNHVVFSKERVGFPDMNAIYNLSDCIVNISLAEGFGLSALEGKMCGKPIIAHTTGGLTRQVVDHETGEEYGVAVKPAAKMLVGNQAVPYIVEDVTKHEDVADAYWKLYEMGQDKREELGKKARGHALKHYDINRMVGDWDRTLTQTIDDWKAGKLPNNKRWGQVKL